ncbi:flavodoxin family protein [Enterovirga sp. CN4-39]|uniref:flavodoxin family protein n=1 Tax=Enterovirga sp. CN4-39 TaxID=3400910 RepID=UPI003C0121F5
MSSDIKHTDAVIAIVYHSGYGHTARQAEAVRRGVEKVPGAAVLFLKSDEAQARFSALEGADAIIFGAPTYMGSASGPFKTFMDATSQVFVSGAWRDKIAAGFTNSGSRAGDKLLTLIEFNILAAQLGMHWVSLGMLPGNNRSDGSENDLNRLVFFLGAAAQSNTDEGSEIAPPASDLRTAEALGERVARVTQQSIRGRLARVEGSSFAVEPALALAEEAEVAA